MIYFFPFTSLLLNLLSLCFVAEMFCLILGSTLPGGCIVRLGFSGRSDASLLVILLEFAIFDLFTETTELGSAVSVISISVISVRLVSASFIIIISEVWASMGSVSAFCILSSRSFGYAINARFERILTIYVCCVMRHSLL